MSVQYTPNVRYTLRLATGVIPPLPTVAVAAVLQSMRGSNSRFVLEKDRGYHYPNGP
jgi:hypothetical protein